MTFHDKSVEQALSVLGVNKNSGLNRIAVERGGILAGKAPLATDTKRPKASTAATTVEIIFGFSKTSQE